MHAEKSNFTVSRMARLLEVSRSGFYAWLKREPSKRAVRAERIEAKIAWFHGDSDEVSGAPTDPGRPARGRRGHLPQDGREDDAQARPARDLPHGGGAPPRSRDSGDTYPPDAAKRVWDTGVLNAVWVGDISYLRTWEGWLYLATVIDAHSRRVIGWAIADHMRTDLVEDALTDGDHPARRAARPRSCSTPTGALNTPRTQITRFAAENGITRSMG